MEKLRDKLRLPAGFGVDRGAKPVSKGVKRTVADQLVESLHALGVRQAFGLTGGANATLVDALGRSQLEVIQFRHEGGAAFAAMEASLASGAPTVLFVTTGPGILNALTGISAARWEGASVIVLSGATSSAQRGRWAAQETSSLTLPVSDLFTTGTLFHFGITLENADQLGFAIRRIAAGLTNEAGFVAHVSLPVALQGTQAPRLGADEFHVSSISAADPGIVRQCASLLRSGPFAIWIGYGARNASDRIRELVRRTGVRVFCTPRAKGIFPEDEPHFLGVTGMGGHEAPGEYVESGAVERVLVLGTRMGEGSSFWDPRLVPPRGFIQVDRNRETCGVAYPSAPTLAVESEIGAFIDALLEYFPVPEKPPVVRRPDPPSGHHPVVKAGIRRVRPQVLMNAIQSVVIDRSDAMVMAEAGNSFAWATHHLRLHAPGRYRVSTGFGSMGHFSAGVVGAALARRGKVVALVGDGAMLMNNEISTAVQHRADAVWIVLNDDGFGMVDQGMRALGLTPVDSRFKPTDFSMFARSMGAHGIRVEDEGDLHAALVEAMGTSGPVVLDVRIDPGEMSPVLSRIESLKKQGVRR